MSKTKWTIPTKEIYQCIDSNQVHSKAVATMVDRVCFLVLANMIEENDGNWIMFGLEDLEPRLSVDKFWLKKTGFIDKVLWRISDRLHDYVEDHMLSDGDTILEYRLLRYAFFKTNFRTLCDQLLDDHLNRSKAVYEGTQTVKNYCFSSAKKETTENVWYMLHTIHTQILENAQTELEVTHVSI